MALISGKNLIAPLTNKTHLTTIILVFIAFAVFRLSGGKIETSPASARKPTATSSGYIAPPVRPTGNNPAGALRDNSRFPWEKSEPSAPVKERKADSLAEIEKLFKK